jgi:DNA-binding FrmR family transcriptional regulator
MPGIFIISSWSAGPVHLQMQAIKAALKKVEEEILKTHASHCVAHAIKSGNVKDQTEKFSELVELFSKYGK